MDNSVVSGLIGIIGVLLGTYVAYLLEVGRSKRGQRLEQERLKRLFDQENIMNLAKANTAFIYLENNEKPDPDSIPMFEMHCYRQVYESGYLVEYMKTLGEALNIDQIYANMEAANDLILHLRQWERAIQGNQGLSPMYQQSAALEKLKQLAREIDASFTELLKRKKLLTEQGRLVSDYQTG